MNRWKRMIRLRDMKLFQKMMFFYVVLLCIPVLVIGTCYIGISYRQLNRQYQKNKEDILEQSRYSIDNALTQVSFCVNSFQYNTGVLQYVDRYDFSTAEGASGWLGVVKPAFEQLKAANPAFDRICIWRKYAKESNDPRYVLNVADNAELQELMPFRYGALKIVFETEAQHTDCRIYASLYDFNTRQEIGYVEADCGFDTLFYPLNYVKPPEVLLLTQGEQSYRVQRDEKGTVYMTPFLEEDMPSGHKVTARMDSLDLTLDYYYSDFKALSNSTMLAMLAGVVLLFLFFTAVYYAFYTSITRRITNLTGHMLHDAKERMTPYEEDPNEDEIGSMVRVYNQTVNRMNSLIEELFQKERLVNQAQYYAMQSQIQPHFLYNTLENIDMLIEVGENEKASRMMAVFGKILRYNLSRKRELSTVGEEIAHIRDYLDLYSFRMRADFDYRIEMADACKHIVCPYCILQPVVENCFKHGFRYLERALWVHVRAYCREEFIVLEVEDNGLGISGERLKEVKDELQDAEAGDGGKEGTGDDASIGLDNVKRRICLLCGEGSGLWIEPKEEGCIVRMRIKI